MDQREGGGEGGRVGGRGEGGRVGGREGHQMLLAVDFPQVLLVLIMCTLKVKLFQLSRMQKQ